MAPDPKRRRSRWAEDLWILLRRNKPLQNAAGRLRKICRHQIPAQFPRCVLTGRCLDAVTPPQSVRRSRQDHFDPLVLTKTYGDHCNRPRRDPRARQALHRSHGSSLLSEATRKRPRDVTQKPERTLFLVTGRVYVVRPLGAK